MGHYSIYINVTKNQRFSQYIRSHTDHMLNFICNKLGWDYDSDMILINDTDYIEECFWKYGNFNGNQYNNIDIDPEFDKIMKKNYPNFEYSKAIVIGDEFNF